MAVLRPEAVGSEAAVFRPVAQAAVRGPSSVVPPRPEAVGPEADYRNRRR
ncbi:MAG: hypothetical protein AAGJ11_07330 [Bacteroidota bacterium]